MQNLTARYNYIYNANLALTNHQSDLLENYQDNYDQLLPVYIGPEVDNSQLATSLNIKAMDEIIKKAQMIIQEKNFSNYIDESYILLGKANFYNGDYYTASEYLDYAAKAYKSNNDSYVESLNWKARSLMQTNRISAANLVLDSLESVLPQLKSAKALAEPFATMAQMSIYQNNDAAAISYLSDAIKASNVKQNKIRWTYILAQLYEKQNDKAKAIENYRRVEHSNAPFEMYFNARLNQIRLKSGDQGVQNQQSQLLALLKDDKNLDYNDQIYFQIAELYTSEDKYLEAEENYRRSVQVSSNNAFQKGLSYLRIADLNFKSLKNYLKAKSYYDSAVTTLPKNYPGYNLVLKKSNNLQYLTDRYETITLQDTLQYIAKLPENERLPTIQTYLNPVIDKSTIVNAQEVNYNYQPLSNQGTTQQSSFYFSNTSAISLGFSDFKKKWGNRRLETNWRQSIRSSSQATNQDVASVVSVPTTAGDTAVATIVNKDALAQQYFNSLPITASLTTISNQKIINAYYEIASFYLQELNDAREAEQVY
ncbi:MAG: gliding motility protein, partial [Pedobacter sp.]